AVSVSRRRLPKKSTGSYLPSFDWDIDNGNLIRTQAFQACRNSLHARAHEVMARLLEGVADDAFEVLQSSPDIDIVDEIPTCVLICTFTFSLRDPHLRYADFITLELGWQEFGSTPSLQNGIKSIVAGILDKYAEESNLKSYINHTLNISDFNTIYRWYEDTFSDEIKPKIVLTLRDFEALPPPLVQDFISLLSYYRKLIPVHLVICVDSSPAAVYRLLPRYTIIQLAMSQVAAPSANETFEAVIGELFFSIYYDAPFALDSTAYDVLFDTFNHSQNSFEHLLHTIDMQLLDHFFQPHSIFFNTDVLHSNMIKDDKVWRYVLSLPSTISYLRQGRDAVDHNLCKEILAEKVNSKGLLKSLVRLRKAFTKSLADENDAFQALIFLRSFIHSVVPDSKEFIPNKRALMQGKMHGELSKPISRAVQNISLMSKTQLYDWLGGYLATYPQGNSQKLANKQLEKFEETFVDNNGEVKLKNKDHTTRDPKFVEFAENCANDWTEFFTSTLIEEKVIPFQEIWTLYTSVDLQMIVNPSPRHAILTALRHPEKLLSQHYEDISNDDVVPSTLTPDITIAFRCYTEGGKLLNLSDWFTAFKAVLNVDEEKKSEKSSKKRKGETIDEDEMEVQKQARFTQAVNELDSIGFLKKASARNRNIVARTVFLKVEDDNDNEFDENEE
ncbi:hypothetical protein E3Q22_00586, partial [Wallemia mellicola]